MIKSLNENFREGTPYPPSAHNAFVDTSKDFSTSFAADHDANGHHNAIQIAHACAFYNGSSVVYSEYIAGIFRISTGIYQVDLNPAIQMRSPNHWGVIATANDEFTTICEYTSYKTDLSTAIVITRGYALDKTVLSDGVPFTLHVFGVRI